MIKIIEIVVSPTGASTVQTKGFAGSECREASKFMEQALGKQTHDQVTGEFYHRTSEHQNLREGAEMAKVRRRIQRPVRSAEISDTRQQARLQKKHEQLAREQVALRRWMTKLRRAFHAVEKQQQRIARLEKHLSQMRPS